MGTMTRRSTVHWALTLAAAGLGGAILATGTAAAPIPAKGAQPQPGDVRAAVARFAELLKARPAVTLPGEQRLGLYLMDVGTGDVTSVASAVDPERAYCGSPGWSADGRRIYFDASPGFGQWAATRLQRLTLTDAGVERGDLGPGNCPSASPDGKSVAYLLNPGVLPDAEPGLYVVDADGRERRRLGAFGIPKWSPDGKHLLVVPFANPCEPTLVDAATGEARPVRVAGHRIYSVPSWAGGGTIVAVVRSQKGFSVALVDVTNPEMATVKETLWKRGDGLAAAVEPLYPVYDPARKRGAFVGREPKGQAVYALESGQAPRRLEPGRLDPKIASLALSPDGRFVLFSADRAVAK